jgi:hypothetical protein
MYINLFAWGPKSRIHKYGGPPSAYKTQGSDHPSIVGHHEALTTFWLATFRVPVFNQPNPHVYPLCA